MSSILGFRFPIITLKNKLTVVNYGSNHRYIFNTGEELNKCSDEVCHETEMVSNHSGLAKVIIDINRERFTVRIPDDKLNNWREYVSAEFPQYNNHKMWLDVFINYQVPDHIIDDMLKITEMDFVDIVLVPYLLMNAWSRECRMQKEIADKIDNNGIKKFSNNWEDALLKMRTCKLEDRVTKIIYSDRFCGFDETLYAEFMRNTLSMVNLD